MRFSVSTALLATMALSVLSGCSTLGSRPGASLPAVEQVSVAARDAEAARQAWLQTHPDWSLQGRAAISKGRNGGSGRIDWRQNGSQYQVQLSAPVTRQSWVLSGDTASGGGQLEGLDGGPRAGDDAEQLLLEATGWAIPVNLLSDWLRGRAVAAAGTAAAPGLDAEGRPRTLQQQGWVIEFLEWYPAEPERPALPRWIEARNGDAKVRLLLDQWDFGAQ